MKIEIISASAGSGKTFSLAKILEDAVVSGTVRPDAIIATTFTKKAAAELTERVRSRLLQAGRGEDTERLSASRIGTVNSVCERLVSEFAFELGLPPRVDVMDESQADAALDMAISGLTAREEEDLLATLEERMDGFSWRKEVKEMIKIARANGIGPERLEEMADRSTNGYLSLFGTPPGDVKTIERDLQRGLLNFVKNVDKKEDKTGITDTAHKEAERILKILERGHKPKWREWAGLADLTVGAKSRHLTEELREAASAHDVHPELKMDIERATKLVYQVASKALEAYQKYKRQQGVVDFTDQEVLALHVLERDDTRKRLKGEIDIVLIDEFQDTSPIQLAIFFRLAELSKRSVWVGDQKQSIFGFRGTDPALMDAAIEYVLGGKKPSQTLRKSYRSRPGLVKFTSTLFVLPFEKYGIPADRVILEPAEDMEPSGLGPFIECWKLHAKNKGQDIMALAKAVSEFLQDAGVRIRDPITGEARRPGKRDIAILCRRNDTCIEVADALESLEISAVISRSGLLDTAEAQAVIAGLRLWADPSDRLAAGQLSLLFHYPDRPDEWLEKTIKEPGKFFIGLAELKAVQEAGNRIPTAGIVTVFDELIEALSLRDYCLKWGNSEQRLANVGALREYAVIYENECRVSGRGITPVGLIRYLEKLTETTWGEQRADKQSALSGTDAVTVSTWHSAKGLEWPVTVLYELDFCKDESMIGVKVLTDLSEIDAVKPLSGRWVQFWPAVYGKKGKGIPFYQRLDGTSVMQEANQSNKKQELRLLYMGWTRARDKVVLAARDGKLVSSEVLQLLEVGEGPRIKEPTEPQVEWAGQRIDVVIRNAQPVEPGQLVQKVSEGYAPSGPRDYPPAFISPSHLEVKGKTGEPVRIGERMAISGSPDMDAVGCALHGFFAADRPGLKPQERQEIAQSLISRWGVSSSLSAEDLVRAGDALWTWIDSLWKGAKLRRELPLEMRNQEGSVIRGTSDLIIELDDIFIIVDHKGFPGGGEEAREHTASFAGQLSAYAECISKAIGKKHLKSFIHLPISGLLIELLTE